MADNDLHNLKIETASKNGTLCFAPDVLGTIAGLALAEVDGLANTTSFSAMLTDKLSKKAQRDIKTLTRGIKVDVKDNTVSVTATVMVEYGQCVQEVSRCAQESIKKTIENMTGMTVKNVDIHVSGLSFEKEDREAAELEYQRYLLEVGRQSEETTAENN